MNTYNNSTAVGHNLRVRREASGITRTALAAAAGVSLPTLVNIEAGVTRNSRTLPQIVASLDRLVREAATNE